jgi:hypothetical protein
VQIAICGKGKFQKVQPKIDTLRQLCPFLKDDCHAANPVIFRHTQSVIPQFGGNIYSEYANYGRTRKIITRRQTSPKGRQAAGHPANEPTHLFSSADR